MHYLVLIYIIFLGLAEHLNPRPLVQDKNKSYHWLWQVITPIPALSQEIWI